MKMALIYLKGKNESWAEEANDLYAQKISGFLPFERIAVKAKSLDRSNSIEKKKIESAAFLAYIEKSDLLVVFDEAGKNLKNSQTFSADLVRLLGRQSRRVVFGIGGAYGFSAEVKNRAQESWSLSPLTMNHHLAQVTALEQIYRALTIWKNFPYHN